MKLNLTRKTRHSDDSLTSLHHIQTEMEKSQREILTLLNEIQLSRTLEEEMDSNQGEILVIKDKLQGSKTALLDFQTPSKESLRNNERNLNRLRLRWKDIQMRR